MYADHWGLFVPCRAGLVVCALLTGCHHDTRQQTGGQEPRLEQQEVSPGSGGATTPRAASAAQQGQGQTSGKAGREAEADDESRLAGDWKGESVVVAKGTAAKDEVVIWHITKASEPGKVSVTADKIVNGKAITMGSGVWTYDKSQKAIVWESRVGVWRMTIKGDTMGGTLTLKDGTVFRRVSLERSR
jgi:hypothetical protein